MAIFTNRRIKTVLLALAMITCVFAFVLSGLALWCYADLGSPSHPPPKFWVNIYTSISIISFLLFFWFAFLIVKLFMKNK